MFFRDIAAAESGRCGMAAGSIQREQNGEPGGARTRDHRIKSAMLYQLSYRPGDARRKAYLFKDTMPQSASVLASALHPYPSIAKMSLISPDVGQ